MPHRPVQLWWLIASCAVSMFLVTMLGLVYTNHVDRKREANERQADRRWCQLLMTLDATYTGNPPSTPAGRAVADAIHGLRVNICDKRNG